MTDPSALEGTVPVFEGRLYKFTNVVKGWQFRWFVADQETGNLFYYLIEDQGPELNRVRGSQYLAGAVVLPSEEDSQTFSVSFASGEVFKLRASNVKERQVWVDRLRKICLLHEEALAHRNQQPLRGGRIRQASPLPAGTRSLLSNDGTPTEALQHLSLTVLDAFGSVHDILHQVDLRYCELVRAIEALPASSLSKPRNPGRNDEDMLVLKASSLAALVSLDNALAVLQHLQETKLHRCARIDKAQSTTDRALSHLDPSHLADMNIRRRQNSEES